MSSLHRRVYGGLSSGLINSLRFMLSFQFVFPSIATLSITWVSTSRVFGVLPSWTSFTNFPAKLVKADIPCSKGSCTRWKARSTARLFLGNKSQISSFTIVTAKNLQFSGGGCFSTLSLTVSADSPPISILSINSAILPSIAGEVTLDLVNAWVRLSTNALWDPDSGLFTEVVLLLSLESSTWARVAAISSALSLLSSSNAGVSSVSSSPEQRRMSSFKFWMASVCSSEFLASCANVVWRPCKTVAMLTSVGPLSFARWVVALDNSAVSGSPDKDMSFDTFSWQFWSF